MNKIFLFALISLILTSCSMKKQDMWESAIIQYEMTSCYQSLKNVYQKNHFEKEGRIWNDDKSVAYCSCTIDSIRKNISQEEYLNAKSKKQSGKILKENSKICKDKYGNWYDES